MGSTLRTQDLIRDSGSDPGSGVGDRVYNYYTIGLRANYILRTHCGRSDLIGAGRHHPHLTLLIDPRAGGTAHASHCTLTTCSHTLVPLSGTLCTLGL